MTAIAIGVVAPGSRVAVSIIVVQELVAMDRVVPQAMTSVVNRMPFPILLIVVGMRLYFAVILGVVLVISGR